MSISREIRELSTVDARRELTKLPEQLESHPGTVAITRRGKPVLAVMTWEDYEAILETLEIMSDSDAVQQLAQSIKEAKEGKQISWQAAKDSLGVSSC